MFGFILTIIKTVFIVIGVISLAVVAYFVYKTRQNRKSVATVHPKNASSVVLITGCDSGLGKASAEKLLTEGYHVVATVFTESGEGLLKEFAKSINKPDNVSTIFTDITKEESVLALEKFVRDIVAGGKQLIGIVNNAGVALPAPLEVQPLAQFKRQIEVNLTGHFHVAQVFTPYLRQSKGRIVNIVSLAGRVASPNAGAYSASKFAMEAITHTQRQELREWGISVSAIEPGFVDTPLVNGVFTDIEKQWDNLLPAARELYGKHLIRSKRAGTNIYKYIAKPSQVAECVYHAITSATPKTRYLVGRDALILGPLIGILPDRVLDEFLRIIT